MTRKSLSLRQGDLGTEVIPNAPEVSTMCILEKYKRRDLKDLLCEWEDQAMVCISRYRLNGANAFTIRK